MTASIPNPISIANAHWPQYTERDPVAMKHHEEYRGYLQDIINEYGTRNLMKSWIKTCNELKFLTEKLAREKKSAIPVIEFADLDEISKDTKKTEKLREAGCLIVRNVVDDDEITGLLEDALKYQKDNKDQIDGRPIDNPCILNVCWSPTQVTLRSKPDHLKLQKWLNELWIRNITGENKHLVEPLTYADAIRLRQPGKPMIGIGPHVDAGSLTRWVDPTYKSCYDAVWSGHPEDLDMFDLEHRQSANQELFPGSRFFPHSRVFRTFQGWTALSHIGEKRGGICLYPFVKITIAYILLRPFFTAKKSPEDPAYLDPENWEIDMEKAWFPGTWADQSQYLSSVSHPHLRLEECLIPIPDVNPGDTVWWHCDMIHAVEVEHRGDEVAAVVYIASVPKTEGNISYVREQSKRFLKGIPPIDFAGFGERTEATFNGYKGVKSIVSKEGKESLLL